MSERENILNDVFERINKFITIAGEFGKRIEDKVRQFQEENKETLEFLAELTPAEIKCNIDNLNEKLKLCMVEVGYPPVSDLELGAFLDIYITKEEKGIKYVKRYIDDFMVSRYDQNAILTLFNNWSRYNWIEDRMSILKEAITAHNMQMYNISIPTLLAQCEGVIAVAFEHKGRMNHKANSKRKKSGNTLEDYLSIMISEVGEDSFAIGVKEFYLEYMLVGFEHGYKIKSPLGRNAILHGGDIKYGTVSNSLKAILMFNELLITLNSVREKKELKITNV